MKPTQPTPINEIAKLAKLADDGVNSFGMVPSTFDRPIGDVIQVGPITLRGTF